MNPTRSKPLPSHHVRSIVTNVIVNLGLSYADAIRWCEDEAEMRAAPYREAAALIQAELDRIDRKPK